MTNKGSLNLIYWTALIFIGVLLFCAFLVIKIKFTTKNNISIVGIRNNQRVNIESIPSSAIELLKTYSGYTAFYQQNDGWIMGKRPPRVGEVCKNFIFNNYTVYPNGTVILSSNYPLDFDYKIRTIKEINSFMERGNLMAHYYEVTFEAVEKNQ